MAGLGGGRSAGRGPSSLDEAGGLAEGGGRALGVRTGRKGRTEPAQVQRCTGWGWRVMDSQLVVFVLGTLTVEPGLGQGEAGRCSVCALCWERSGQKYPREGGRAEHRDCPLQPRNWLGTVRNHTVGLLSEDGEGLLDGHSPEIGTEGGQEGGTPGGHAGPACVHAPASGAMMARPP
jgi:hypothetical protein